MEKTEAIFKIIEIIIAIIGTILVMFGLVIPYRHSKKAEAHRVENEKEADRNRWKKELVDNQISKLYGPIYALIIEGEVMFSRVLYQLGRNSVIPKGLDFDDLPEDDKKVWRHYVNTYKIPYQLKMVEIMRNNFHLIKDSEIPVCYKKFLDYSLGWEMLDNQKRNSVPNFYKYHYIDNYPIEFNHYIRSTLEDLLSQQARLIKATVGISTSIKVN